MSLLLKHDIAAVADVRSSPYSRFNPQFNRESLGMELMKAGIMRVYTIGFTKTSAEAFFSRLQTVGVRRVLDVRLNNVSQLAGFAKKDDLRYFLKTICAIGYEHHSELAPTQKMLDAYKKAKGSWIEYETQFLDLMARRRIEKTLKRDVVDGGCLLCSEDTPHHCHRRLVLEYLQEKWGDLEIIHL
jgi:uncharacterized protein (DUF488 family)